MKVYTIIANFSVGDYNNHDECWIANYKNKKDAVEAFRFKLRETGCLQWNGKIAGECMTVEYLFDYLLMNGCCYDGYDGSERNRWFVRGEEVQDEFDGDIISWD